MRDATSGATIPNASLQFGLTGSYFAGGSGAFATTNAQGAFAFDASQFFELAAGGFQSFLTASATAYFQKAGGSRAYAPPFPATQDFDLLSAVGTVLQGTVTDRDTGAPLAGAKLYLHGATNAAVAATTDANGQYAITGSLFTTTSGPLTVQAVGHFTRRVWYNITGVPTTVDVTLLGAATPIVQGIVRDASTAQPVPGASLAFALSGDFFAGGSGAVATTDANGGYAFEAAQFFETVTSGFQSVLTVSRSGYFQKSGGSVFYAPPFPVTQNFDLQSSAGTVLQGIVTDRDTGTPLAGAKLYLHGATNAAVAAMTDANGSYTIDGSKVSATSGPLTVQAAGHFTRRVTLHHHVGANDCGRVAAGGSGPHHSGTVRDSATDLPIGGASLLFSLSGEFFAGGSGAVATTDASGSYAFDASQFFESVTAGFASAITASRSAYFPQSGGSRVYGPLFPVIQDFDLAWNGTTRAITIGTNVPNLTFSVDGIDYVAPQTFDWIPGSPHTVATTTPQAGPAGTHYRFNAWSNSGAISHTLSAPDTNSSITAQFVTQYQLTTAVNPSSGGTITAGGLFDAGSSIVITAAPAAQYQFNGFSGDLSGATNPQTLVMNAPGSVTANFTRTNTVPVAGNDVYTTAENVPLNVGAPGVLSNDSDGDGDSLGAVPVQAPAHGSLSLNGNGSFTYTPTPNFSGADSFTYKAYDGASESNVATVSISVTAAPLTVTVTSPNGGEKAFANVPFTIRWTPVSAATSFDVALSRNSGGNLQRNRELHGRRRLGDELDVDAGRSGHGDRAHPCHRPFGQRDNGQRCVGRRLHHRDRDTVDHGDLAEHGRLVGGRLRAQHHLEPQSGTGLARAPRVDAQRRWRLGNDRRLGAEHDGDVRHTPLGRRGPAVDEQRANPGHVARHACHRHLQRLVLHRRSGRDGDRAEHERQLADWREPQRDVDAQPGQCRVGARRGEPGRRHDVGDRVVRRAEPVGHERLVQLGGDRARDINSAHPHPVDRRRQRSGRGQRRLQNRFSHHSDGAQYGSHVGRGIHPYQHLESQLRRGADVRHRLQRGCRRELDTRGIRRPGRDGHDGHLPGGAAADGDHAGADSCQPRRKRG